MNTTQLKYFIAVYEEKNITAAARRCFISQPSISNALKELEEELDTKLFVRHKKGVDITNEAHYLYPLALRITNDIDKLPELFNKQKKKRPLTVSLFKNLSPSKLSKTISNLNSDIDNLRLTLVEDGTEANARITLDVLKHEDEIFVPLWEEDYRLCAAKHHPINDLGVVTPQDLHKFDFLECPSCEAHQQTIGLLACEGLGLNIVASGENKCQVMYLVQSGIGVSFLPTGVLEMGSGINLIPFDGPRMFRRIGFCYPANKSLSSVLADVIKVLSGRV